MSSGSRGVITHFTGGNAAWKTAGKRLDAACEENHQDGPSRPPKTGSTLVEMPPPGGAPQQLQIQNPPKAAVY